MRRKSTDFNSFNVSAFATCGHFSIVVIFVLRKSKKKCRFLDQKKYMLKSSEIFLGLLHKETKSATLLTKSVSTPASLLIPISSCCGRRVAAWSPRS